MCSSEYIYKKRRKDGKQEFKYSSQEVKKSDQIILMKNGVNKLIKL